jgi:hypothetical protein
LSQKAKKATGHNQARAGSQGNIKFSHAASGATTQQDSSLAVSKKKKKVDSSCEGSRNSQTITPRIRNMKNVFLIDNGSA